MIPDLAKTLQHSGLRATAPRRAIFELLVRAKRPLRAQDLHTRLPEGIADQATVYRILHTFTEIGLARRIDLLQQASYFELERGDDHHHLVCQHCGTMEEVPGCDVERLERQVLKASQFASIDRHLLEFFGTCKRCAR